MEKDSIFLKLSKSPRAFILIVIILISSLITNDMIHNYVISEFYPNQIITLDQLDYIPEKYIPFSNLASFGIQTIFNSNNGTLISFKDFLEIIKITAYYETFIVKHNENYYYLRFANPSDGGTPIIPIQFQVLSYIIMFVSITSIILITVIILVNILKILNRAFQFG